MTDRAEFDSPRTRRFPKNPYKFLANEGLDRNLLLSQQLNQEAQPSRVPMKKVYDMSNYFHYVLTGIADFLHFQQRFAGIHGFIHDFEGYALLQLAAHGEGVGAIVEIGSFMGRSTAFLAAGSLRTGREKVFAIDHFRGSPENQPGQQFSHYVLEKEGTTFRVFQANMKQFGLSEQVVPVPSDSAAAAQNWQSPIRLLFVDGDHSYESVRRDLSAWLPFVVNRGYVCFHDFGVAPGVTRFVQDLLQQDPTLREAINVQSLKILQKTPG